MESSDLLRKKRQQSKSNRRKVRAEKVEKERRATVGEEDLDIPEVRQPRPLKRPRNNKPRKPVVEEDIVEGFAITAYKSYEDLTRALKLAEGEATDRNVCDQLLKRSSEGGENKGKETEKEKKSQKSPRTKSSAKSKLKENMVNKNTTTENRLSTGASPPPPFKKARTNGPSLKEPVRKIVCESDEVTGDKVSDALFGDLFATQRKDSSPNHLDNLHSSNEEKGSDPPEKTNHINHDVSLNSASSTAGTLTLSPTAEIEALDPLPIPLLPIPYLTGPPSVNSNPSLPPDVNGHTNNKSNSQNQNQNQNPPSQVVVKESFVPKPRVIQTLFTPYATTSITRVSTPIGPSSSQSLPESEATLSLCQSDHSSQHSVGVHNTHPSSCDFTLSGSQIHHSSSPPVVEKTGNGTGPHKIKQPPGSSSSLFYSRVSHNHGTSGKVTPTNTSTNKSTTFGSIARLLDSSTNSTNSRNNSFSATAVPVKSNTRHRASPQQLPIPSREQNSSLVPTVPQSFASRSLSPRGHSPSRERDSYSSNVSSLSRSSITPVSGSSQQLIPPNLSPIQSLSYAKAASWLSSVPPGLSPVPRPTPPPGPLNYPLPSGHLTSGASHPHTSTHSPQSIYSGLVPGGPHSILPPHSTSAMFAPPILPLSSILPHQVSQSSPFCPSAESIFHGASSSEMVRRDLESRFLSVDRSHAGSSSFMTRPGELHPHHTGLQGVNHLQPHNPGGQNSTHPHPSSLFPPPMFKDLPKVGLDSPFYRGALGYPFNGMLQPPNISTPFTPPSQLTTFTPKKSGRWNAMHVRIAWEIYQHQQKGGEGKSGAPGKNSLNPSTSHNLTAPTSSSLVNSEFLRQQTNQVFPGMTRPPEVSFASPLLSPHMPPTHRPPFDSPHPLFLHSGSLGEAEADASYSSYLSRANAGLNYFMTGPPLSRYGFGGLGPTFAGLNSLGSSLLNRDLSSLATLGSAQDQWLRMQRLQSPLYPPIGVPPGLNWPVQRPERESRTPTESRRHKEERQEKRQESSHSESKGGRDSSPFRDRSPIRSSRTTPLENGDTDSRSSRSSDSHSTVQPPSSKFSRLKDEANANGDRNKTPTLSERDSYLHSSTNTNSLNENNKGPPNFLPSGHPSRVMFHPTPPMTTASITSGWDSFPGMSSGPRMSSAENFRLTLLQLSEREREFSRIPPHQQLRAPLFNNGPYGIGGSGMLPPGSNSSNGSSTNHKSGPPLGPMSHLNPSMSAASLNAMATHGHHHSSQNGPNSPHKTDLEPPNSRIKDESHSHSR